MKIVFFGTPPFAANLLKALHEKGFDIVGIVTKPDKAQGRSTKLIPPAVKELALKEAPHIPLFQPEVVSKLEFAPTLEALNADLFLVVAYGEIIKQHLLDMPRYGCINVHASLLPKYRGAAPIQRAIIDGEKESGVTIMQMVKKMDAGDIIKIEKVEISKNMTYGELEQALCQASIEPLVEVLNEYNRGVIPSHVAQDVSLVTFAPKIELEDCQIVWANNAETVHNLIRGVNPEPGAWCNVLVKGEAKRLKIFMSEVIEDSFDVPPGSTLEFGKKGFSVACGNGALNILELQLEGKKRMKAKDFACGLSKEQITLS